MLIRNPLKISVAATAALLAALLAAAPANAQAPCDPPVNEIACENSKPGTHSSDWQVSGAGDLSIQGFATQMSVDQGSTIDFKVKTDATDYRVEIYRTGWYGGLGARLVDTVQPPAGLPQTQPSCLTELTTGLIDCANWSVSATWQVPADAVSGVYIARLERADTGGASHITFVVRDDDGASDLIVQTSDTTWQAYNSYGGMSLYNSSPGTPWWSGRSYKVSYNRPLTMREGSSSRSSYFGAEYPLVRWLERNGYDASYTSGVDTASRGQELLEHRVFVSSGHDEYWSQEQRANVEAARAAGVNLAFFSGNEVFWKTRWEPSLDSSETSFRTMVSYKESNNSFKFDPSPIWTGTWRDARFSPPSDGGRPENALTGQLFMVNSFRHDPMRVPAAEGALRFWRDTDFETLAPGEVGTLPAGVLGYEWDEDRDNGFRPPGLFRVSSTTMDLPFEYLLNYGTQYGSGRATHSMTLYRAPSGALVFGSGTIQWAWGLDDEHDNPGTPEDPRIKQATVNLFADMGVQPTTLQSTLIPATQSTDTVAPTVEITGPAAGTSLERSEIARFTGTAADAGGGRVGGVEISTDNGSTWHPATTGRERWTYDWAPTGFGTLNVRVRAVDDSGNIGPVQSVPVEVGSCPCSLWSDLTVPMITSAPDNLSYELGVKFRAEQDGYVTGVRFYKGAGNTGTHLGHLWRMDGTRLGEVTFRNETASGWQRASFAAPIPIQANTTYIVSYWAPNGHYAMDRPYLQGTDFENRPLRALRDGEDGPNAVFKSGSSAFPTQTKLSSNYWVDVVFDQSGTDSVPPSVASAKPGGSSTSGLFSNATVGFDEPLDPASVTGANFELRGPSGATIPASVSYDAATRTATLDPTSRLDPATTYDAVVRGGAGGIRDAGGNPLAQDYAWSFSTFTCPCSLWSDATRPLDASYPDPQGYELGVKFRSEIDGYITGVRFYKGTGNTGTHVGHLWSSSGAKLGEVTFSGETATGWQQATFPAPLAVQAGVTYIASYWAPNGRYAMDRPYFTSARENGPLRALRDGEDGPNSVFKSGSSAFPTQTKLSSNYWVDVVFSQTADDSIAPSVTSTTPASGATGVGASAVVTAQFDEALAPASVTTSSFELRGSSGATVPAAVSYDAASKTARLTPTGKLSPATTYTAFLRGGAAGVRDVAGNPAAADRSWSFTTFTCPCTIWPDTALPNITAYPDFQAYELGLKFRAETDGYATGVRFYKGAGNTGTHVGHLWSAAGAKLGEVTFTGETASGWQRATFSSPVAITADTTYVVSYWSPVGRYAMDRPYFANSGVQRGPLRALRDGEDGPNAVFKSASSAFPTQSKLSSNYWVDVIFETQTNQVAVNAVTNAVQPLF
jgi:hypothetical protein